MYMYVYECTNSVDKYFNWKNITFQIQIVNVYGEVHQQWPDQFVLQDQDMFKARVICSTPYMNAVAESGSIIGLYSDNSVASLKTLRSLILILIL